MNRPPFDVLYEDNHLLVVNKPALLPTMGVAAGEPSLLEACKEYVKQKYNKPGNVYLGVVSRLDAPVTGVVVIARTSKAAARLSAAFRDREVDKTYWAIVSRDANPRSGQLEDWLYKDERHRRMHIGGPDTPDAKFARLHYRQIASLADGALFEVQLETGRKHQIRLQLAHHGMPIVGDRKYGSRAAFPRGIALHARQVKLLHPVRQTPLDITAPVPSCWSPYGVDR